jgi:hypothetical protein
LVGKEGIDFIAKPRLRAAAMSEIALTLGSLRSQGRLIENSICDSPASTGDSDSMTQLAQALRVTI